MLYGSPGFRRITPTPTPLTKKWVSSGRGLGGSQVLEALRPILSAQVTKPCIAVCTAVPVVTAVTVFGLVLSALCCFVGAGGGGGHSQRPIGKLVCTPDTTTSTIVRSGRHIRLADQECGRGLRKADLV